MIEEGAEHGKSHPIVVFKNLSEGVDDNGSPGKKVATPFANAKSKPGQAKKK